VFHVVGQDSRVTVTVKKVLRRGQMMAFFAKISACRVGMEACASAHYWARQLSALGHDVRLIPTQYVKAYVQGNKNDYNDALAMAEAVTRPRMRFVPAKTEAQQDIQALHRLREKRGQDRTALCNQLRGLLAEYGLIMPRGVHILRRRIPELLEDAENGLSTLFRRLLNQGYLQLCELDVHIEAYSEEVKRFSREDDACRRLQTSPGFVPMVSSAYRSHVCTGRITAAGAMCQPV
jgi:transposase